MHDPSLVLPVATLALTCGSTFALAGNAVAAAARPHPAAARQGRPAGFQPGGLMIRPGAGARPARGGRSSTATSTNWSGYAVTGASGAYRRVSASWTEPAASCSGRAHQYASFWVGLDGYNSSSVEQTGTDSDCSGGTPSYYGWYEMYPAYPVNFSNPVSPGDQISASVTFSGRQTYTLVPLP